jgi:hypothetical protein
MEFKKGGLKQAFKNLRKTALVIVAGVTLTGCATTGMYTGGGTYGNNNAYNQPRGYSVTYTPSRVPWANDPNYRQEVQLAMTEANMDIRQAYSTYQVNLANCNSRFTSNISRNAQANERARRDGTTFGERMQNGARWNQTTADFNNCKVRAETRFQQTLIREQQSFNSAVNRLDTKYKRAYGQ